MHRTPDGLSGGQLQRCALVRALAAQPALLVCDEVTSALDSTSREQVLDALPKLLAPSATAMLLISHDVPTVRAVAQEAVVFDRGAVVFGVDRSRKSCPSMLPGSPVRGGNRPAGNVERPTGRRPRACLSPDQAPAPGSCRSPSSRWRSSWS
ncbi:ATP-binding cassette domain-containing protein [Streptomyces sp. SID7803]|nr:ATP-binding cassette domain-containing protein [Streptomyces sp. SID7803]